MITCCRDCKSRTIGCHGSCSKYQSERKEWERIKEIKRRAELADWITADQIHDSIGRNRFQKGVRRKTE